MNVRVNERSVFLLSIALMAAIVFNVTGCSLQPKTPGESALLATYSLSGIYQSIATLRESDRLTKQEARDLFVKADQAEVSLRTARIALDAGDENTFQQNMLVATRLLMTIESNLKSKEIEVLP